MKTFELFKWTGLMSCRFPNYEIVWYLHKNGVWYYWHLGSWYEAGFEELKEDATHIRSSPLEFLVQTGKDFYKTLESI